MSTIFGIAKDGTKFDESSFEVKEYLKEFPDVTLEAAIGSVVMKYDEMFEAPEEVVA